MARSWPLTTFIGDFTAGPPNVPGSGAVDLQAGKTALRQLSTQRGRQYELGVVQAGTMTVDLTDTSEYLNPANSSSPWNSGSNTLLPYRCIQYGAWWNPATKDVTGNLLNSTNFVTGSSTGKYDPSFESGKNGFFAYAGTPTLATSTVQHFDGAQSLAVGFNAATDVVLMALPSPLTPGATYTLSLYVYVPAGDTVTATFSNYPGSIGSTVAAATSSTTGAWQRLTMTGPVAGAFAVVQVKAAGTFPQTVYLDATQFEIGSIASTFTTSGPTFNAIFTGYIERYPQAWDSAGFRGLKPLVSVDALSPLSRAAINQSYAQTIAADNPQIYMPLNDASAPQVVQRPTGGQQMVGYTQLGSNSGAVNFSGDTFLDGSKAVTVVQQNTSPVTLSDNTMVTYLGTRQGALSMNTQSFTLEMWVKFSSGTAYFGAGSMQPGETTIGQAAGTSKGYTWYTSRGNLGFHLIDPNGSSSPLIRLYQDTSTPWNGYPDGQWHYLVLLLPGGNNFQYYIDGVLGAANALGFTPSARITVDNFYFDATTYFGDSIAGLSAANVAAYPTSLTSAQLSKHYQRGIGYLGELSGNRAQRLLTQYWSSNVVTDPGRTAMSTDFYYDPPTTPGTPSQAKQVLAALQDIAATEGGLVWADAGGKIHFDSRETRYTNAQSAQYVFGENTAAGELPYDGGIAYDYDPTYVYSEADLTGGTGNQLPPIVNSTSQTNYGQRIFSATLFMANDWDVQQAGQFYVQRYAQPAGGRGSTAPMRISKLTINPAENPNLWQAALSLDIGERITVKRRTSPGVTMTGDYYIEQVSHNVNAAASTWTVDYQLSPVWNPQVWKLGDATNGVLGTTSICVY